MTDSHWNGRGAFIGYRELAEELSHRFPHVKPLGDVSSALSLRSRIRVEAGDVSGASEDVLTGVLRAAWNLRLQKNAKPGKKSKPKTPR